MAIVSGIEVEDWQIVMLRSLINRMWAEDEDERVVLTLVEEPDGVFTVDDGDSIIFEFVPKGWYGD